MYSRLHFSVMGILCCLSISCMSFGKTQNHQLDFLPSSQKPESRPTVSLPSLTELFELSDLQEAVTVIRDGEGRYSVQLRNTPSAEKARVRIQAAFEGRNIFKELQSHFEDEVELSVMDPENKLISREKVPVLGAALAMALSLRSRDRLPGGRRLFLRDSKNKLTSFSPISKSTEKVESIKIAFSWAGELNEGFRFTTKFGSDEPPEQLMEWDTVQNTYSLVPNKKAREVWEGRNTASRFLSDPEVKSELLRIKSTVTSHASAEAAAEAFLSQEKIASLIHRGEASPHQAGPIIKKAVTKFLKSYSNPNNPESFSIEKRKLGYRESVVDLPSPDVERIAFIYPDGNSSLRKNTARSSGVHHIHSISRPSQAIPLIKNLFEKSGKPVEVYFCSHGGPGKLVMANPSSSEIDLLTRETKGMVSAAYALGCSVGAQAENLNRDHLLRELSVGWGAPVSAVDKTLYLDSFRWYSQGGRLVTVFPRDQEVSATELIDQTPVWLLPEN